MNKHIVSIIPALGLLTNLATAADRPLVMLIDVTHGQAPPSEAFISGAAGHGIEVRKSSTNLARDSLAGVRLLYLRAPTAAFAPEEKAAVIEYVREGGALLLVLDEEQRTSLDTGVNDLIVPFGMRLTADTEYLHNCGAIARAGEINRGDREIPFSGGRAVEGGTPFAFQLDREGKAAQPFAAWAKPDGGGRIVVLGEGMASGFLGSTDGVRLSGVPRDASRTTYWGKDSFAFMDEIFAWLLGL
jgi:hypothetical protein